MPGSSLFAAGFTARLRLLSHFWRALLTLVVLFPLMFEPLVAAAQVPPNPPRLEPPRAPGVPREKDEDVTVEEAFRETPTAPAPTPPLAAGQPAPPDAGVQPFGSNLFIGNFLRAREDGLNPNYILTPGDHVAVNT